MSNSPPEVFPRPRVTNNSIQVYWKSQDLISWDNVSSYNIDFSSSKSTFTRNTSVSGSRGTAWIQGQFNGDPFTYEYKRISTFYTRSIISLYSTNNMDSNSLESKALAGLYLDNGQVGIMSNGQRIIANATSTAPDDTYKNEYNGSTFKFYKNGTQFYELPINPAIFPTYIGFWCADTYSGPYTYDNIRVIKGGKDVLLSPPTYYTLQSAQGNISTQIEASTIRSYVFTGLSTNSTYTISLTNNYESDTTGPTLFRTVTTCDRPQRVTVLSNVFVSTPMTNNLDVTTYWQNSNDRIDYYITTVTELTSNTVTKFSKRYPLDSTIVLTNLLTTGSYRADVQVGNDAGYSAASSFFF